mmetsp:Transcript_4061/g.11739  ORF Transcript_4061/g.11739 Transcript_4061/m.11739 type:complete len:341 (-) Transcript_4061:946-1968(-)
MSNLVAGRRLGGACPRRAPRPPLALPALAFAVRCLRRDSLPYGAAPETWHGEKRRRRPSVTAGLTRSTPGPALRSRSTLHAVAASDRPLSTICSLSGDKVREMARDLGPRGHAMKELKGIRGVTSVHPFPTQNAQHKHLMSTKDNAGLPGSNGPHYPVLHVVLAKYLEFYPPLARVWKLAEQTEVTLTRLGTSGRPATTPRVLDLSHPLPHPVAQGASADPVSRNGAGGSGAGGRSFPAPSSRAGGSSLPDGGDSGGDFNVYGSFFDGAGFEDDGFGSAAFAHGVLGSTDMGFQSTGPNAPPASGGSARCLSRTRRNPEASVPVPLDPRGTRLPSSVGSW